eukprot:scaffold22395_cov61-Phaeocystis_antarctica.AAC.2
MRYLGITGWRRYHVASVSDSAATSAQSNPRRSACDDQACKLASSPPASASASAAAASVPASAASAEVVAVAVAVASAPSPRVSSLPSASCGAPTTRRPSVSSSTIIATYTQYRQKRITSTVLVAVSSITWWWVALGSGSGSGWALLVVVGGISPASGGHLSTRRRGPNAAGARGPAASRRAREPPPRTARQSTPAPRRASRAPFRGRGRRASGASCGTP